MSSLTKTCFDFNDDLCQNKQENTFDKEILNSYDSWIISAKHEQVDTKKLPANQKQLYTNQHDNLQQDLAKYIKLFDESLGVYHP